MTSHDDERVDFTPLFGSPDPARLERLASRIAASVAVRRRPRSVLAQMVSWAPAAIGLAAAVAVLAWVPAVVAPPAAQADATAAMLLELALDETGDGAGRLTWFAP